MTVKRQTTITGTSHYFMLQANDQYYQVSSFILTLRCDSIHKLGVALPVGQRMSASTTQQARSVVSPFQLYTRLQEEKTLKPIVVTLYDFGHGQFTTVFHGILVGIQPQIGTDNTLYIACQCLGMPAMLMYSPMSDFVFMPKGGQSAPQRLQQSGLGKNLSLTTPYGNVNNKAQVQFNNAAFDMLYKGICSKSGSTIQQMFQAIQTKLETAMKNALGVKAGQTYEAGAKIQDYIKSVYKLGPLAGLLNGKPQKASQNQFLRMLCYNFLRNVQSGGTIYQCVQDTLQNDLFLRLVPDSTGDYMYICPSYDMSFKDGPTLQASDIVGMHPAVVAAQSIRTPGILHVNFTGVSNYGPVDKAITKLQSFGTYEFDKESGRHKIIVGPQWCLANINKKIRTDSNYKQQNDMNAIAKLMYFQRYGKGSTCMLQLADTQSAAKLKQSIGKAICINTKDIQVNAVLTQDMKKIEKLYGQLKWYQLRYTAAQHGSMSSMSIRIGLDRFWSQKSPFSELFKKASYNNSLYEKQEDKVK